MNLRSVGAVLVVLVASTAIGAKQREEPKPSIEDLAAKWEGDRVAVSYRLGNVLPDETLERIHSGIPIHFQHKVEIVEKRPGLFASDPVYARTVVNTRVEYDSLTQRYELTRDVEVRSRSKQPLRPPVHDQVVTNSDAEMRGWMIDVATTAWLDPARPIPDLADLWVRVEVSLGRRWFLLIFPATQSISAEQELARKGP